MNLNLWGLKLQRIKQEISIHILLFWAASDAPLFGPGILLPEKKAIAADHDDAEHGPRRDHEYPAGGGHVDASFRSRRIFLSSGGARNVVTTTMPTTAV